jgi:CBS domain-containing protein
MKLPAPVGSVMRRKSGEIWSIGPEATVYEAIEMMASREIGALLVVVEGRLEGILSERDYARKVVLQGKSSRGTRVREVMTAPVVSVSPEDSVDRCMGLMTECRVRHLPVLEDGRVVGIVSIGDLVKWIISEQQETIDRLHSYIAGNYPA